MKLPLSVWMFAIAGIVAPAAAGQQVDEMKWGQKARPDPIVSQTGNAATTRAMGVCYPVPSSPEHFSLENVLSPKGDAGYYFRSYENKDITYDTPAAVTVLQQPTHGMLRLETEANHFGTGRFDSADSGYAYLPTNHYLGKDKAIFLVDFGNGLKVRVIYFLQAVGGTTSGNDWEQVFCGETGYHWKVSSTKNEKWGQIFLSRLGIH